MQMMTAEQNDKPIQHLIYQLEITPKKGLEGNWNTMHVLMAIT